MDQVKTGKFFQTLRKEKGLTQERLAERLGVSRRTVSRWESGSNMPDLDILMELSDFYRVDLRELLNGERKSGDMNEKTEETVKKIAEYDDARKKKFTRLTLIYFIIGAVALVANIVLELLDVDGGFWFGFLEGCTLGAAISALALGIIYTSGALFKIKTACRRRNVEK